MRPGGRSVVAADAIPARYEFKYAVPEGLVPDLRRAIEPYCALDPHAARAPDHRYVIRSLYLDTWCRDLYRLSREGRPRRVKLRVRAYEDGPVSGAVFLEIKEKERGLVLKSRTRIPAAGWAERLRGPAPADADRIERWFRDEIAGRGLDPALLVRYEREAWVGRIDRYARVTFDRRITCAPTSSWSLDAGRGEWLALDDRAVMKGRPRGTVLELKCERDVPRWMCRLVERFALEKIGISKYCSGVERAWMPVRVFADRAAPLREGRDHG